MNEPLFSLLIPMWNVSPYLPALWESVACQQLEDTEVIFINDGSPDDCAKIIDRHINTWQDSHSRETCPFRLLYQNNTGVGAARNNGLDQARGQYVWFIDSDDMLSPNALQELRKAVHAFPSADCIFFPFIQLHEEKTEKIHHVFEINWEQCLPFALNLPPKELQQDNRPLFLQQPAPWNKIYKRSFLLKNEGARFAKNLWYEDLQFFVNMLAFNPRWVAWDKPLYAYRLRPGSTMHHQLDPRHFDIHQILRNIEMFYYKMNLHGEFETELEAVNAYHGYLFPMTRLIKYGADHQERNKLKRWMIQNCPDYARNPLLSRRQKILGFLYDWNLGFLVRLLK